jgi:tRNA (guanine37-N1)-methyltransferase
MKFRPVYDSASGAFVIKSKRAPIRGRICLMRFDVFTLFPEVFPAYLGSSILQRAQERGILEVHLHNLRDYARDRHRTTDDLPYGGGGGMVMKPEPIFEA